MISVERGTCLMTIGCYMELTLRYQEVADFSATSTKSAFQSRKRISSPTNLNTDREIYQNKEMFENFCQDRYTQQKEEKA